MAVQPARWASTGLRPIGATPRIRQTRSRSSRGDRVAASPATRSAAVAMRPATAQALRPAAGAGVRPLTRAIRVAAPELPTLPVEWQARLRVRPSATLLALIIAGTMLGLVYVTQMLAAQSARYEVDTLLVQRRALVQQLTSQEASIAQWGSEAQVVQWAQREGYDRLGVSIRLKAR